MSKNIDICFNNLKKQKKAAFITYIMACDPDYKTSLNILKKLPEAGVDIIELGVPFSDPMADGPIIQAAANRALKAGASVKKVLLMVADFRKYNKSTPVILMTYYNPVYHYGLRNFARDAKKSGVDGIIIVDLPPEEENEFTSVSDLSLIKLTAPTTTKPRARVVLNKSSGFVYYISISGITGTKKAGIEDIKKSVKRLKESTKLPVAVGFGVKTPEQAKEISKVADGVVIGSAIVEKIQESSEKEVISFIKSLSLAIKG